MTILKYAGLVLGALLIWLILIVVTRQLAYDVVSFFAASITNSCSYGTSYSCGYFEWDKELRIVSYVTYSVLFIVLSYASAIVLRSNKSKLIKVLAITCFILSFPTYTHWGVASICGGFGGCTTGYYIDVVVPLVMTAGVFTLPSMLIAIFIVWVYIRINKLSI
ncbi:hypothetical protein [Aliamphritea spongicola]|uniref:hypothetical protein n=1 Tax=Aliamphritea spongicola TaxID=707589 RepID=UPI00196B0719|nr:hypothetical protein [Aliamphritea spongicola]MBN3561739.1 hypothetical protein [Aliamphritea spongicola]